MMNRSKPAVITTKNISIYVLAIFGRTYEHRPVANAADQEPLPAKKDESGRVAGGSRYKGPEEHEW